MNRYVWLLVFLTGALSARAQSKEETIRHTGTFGPGAGGKVVAVENIHGSIKVTGYNGREVVLEARKTIKARSTDEVTKGLREVQVRLVEAGDSIYVFLEAPFIHRRRGRNHFLNLGRDEINYEFHVDMTLRVPAAANLKIATVNEGEIAVQQVAGSIRASNVNGPITLTGVAGKVEANTVNGKIEVTLDKQPHTESRFKTVNGDVTVRYPGNLDAQVSFKTLNGDFFTDLKDTAYLPARVSKNTGTSGNGTVYKIGRDQSLKVGKGGPLLRFETLNGNIYLKKK